MSKIKQGFGAVIVTGASRGIGAAVAMKLSARGIPVCINHANSEDEAEGVVRQIAALGGKVCSVKADLSDEADIVRLFCDAEAELGNIAGLVNNAGFTGQAGRRIADAKADVLRRTFAVNAIAPMLCARELIARASTSNGATGGRIVNVSSIASRIGSPNDWVDYAASKAALNAMTLGLAKEVAREAIQVNGVAPGIIETAIHRLAGKPERLEKMASLVPLGRAGLPDEVADVIVWLMLDAPDYVHGTTIDVAGGL